MKYLWASCGILLAALFLMPTSAAAAPINISLSSFATGLNQPIDITNTGIPDDDRLFVAERDGVIKIVESNGTVSGTFIDIDSVVSTTGEGGLLGLAFHPDYDSNGYFYVYFTNNSGNLQVNRYTADGDPETATTASTGSALTIITVAHPTNSNHNGGDVAFGADGYLYLAPGDGGSGGDPPNNAQNKDVLLGKVLRLDVDNPSGGNNYGIPAGNPFVGIAGADEIFALGLRNPFRFSFDRVLDDLWIGDVGQGDREEIDRIPAGTAGGQNLGWSCFEGTTIENSSRCNTVTTHTAPIFEYAQSSPKAVTGGVVYRGTAQPALRGQYVFADFYSGQLWTTWKRASGFRTAAQTKLSNRNLVSFGENVDGELFAADLVDGIVFRVQGTFTTSYAAEWVGQIGTPTIGSGQQATVSFDFRNVGTQTWNSDGPNPVRIATANPRDRGSNFFSSSWLAPTRLATFANRVEPDGSLTPVSTIEPGQVGRFQFTLTGPPQTTAATFKEYFEVAITGIAWAGPAGAYVPVTMPARSYAYQWVSQTYAPSTVSAGSTHAVSVTIKNTGTATWRRDGKYPLRLGTTRPRDRHSRFRHSGWASVNRITTFNTQGGGGADGDPNSIGPNENATFSFSFSIPSGAGLFREYVEPVVKNYKWLGDKGIYWPLVVN